MDDFMRPRKRAKDAPPEAKPVKLSYALYRRVKICAAYDGRRMQALFDEAVENWLAKHETRCLGRGVA